MLFAVTLTLAAAAAVSASPLEPRAKTTAVLPLKHVVHANSIKGIVQKGQARIRKVNGESTVRLDAVSSGSVTNEDVSYVAPVVIGGNTWNLIVDTGCK
jgi:hypothetical protein